jgi:DNA-binding GntR family transcriptional regulator
VSPVPDPEQFLRDNFKSVWSLELLLHLEANPERRFTPAELVEALRASRGIVEQSIGSLVAAALIVVEEGGHVSYAPADPRLRRMVARIRDDYALRPDAVRRTIVTSGASAFADAFRLRKD